MGKQVNQDRERPIPQGHGVDVFIDPRPAMRFPPHATNPAGMPKMAQEISDQKISPQIWRERGA
jgi:hypothetical protein